MNLASPQHARCKALARTVSETSKEATGAFDPPSFCSAHPWISKAAGKLPWSYAITVLIISIVTMIISPILIYLTDGNRKASIS